MREFRDDDEGYVRWLQEHPQWVRREHLPAAVTELPHPAPGRLPPYQRTCRRIQKMDSRLHQGLRGER